MVAYGKCKCGLTPIGVRTLTQFLVTTLHHFVSFPWEVDVDVIALTALAASFRKYVWQVTYFSIIILVCMVVETTMI